MANQESILPITGTIQKLTFYKSQGGYMVKAKTVISADKIANSPAYERTRENIAEFSRAGQAAKLLRKAYENIITRSKDRLLTSRLTSEMYKVVVSDATSDRGQRNVIDGNAALLTGFEFNNRAKLDATLKVPFTASIDRATGNLAVNIPAFVPANLVVIPQGATHFQLFMGAAAIDFEAATYEIEAAESAILEYSNTATAAFLLKSALTANSLHPLFLAFGIEFMQQVNGKMYPLNNGGYNACSIIKVDTGV